MVWKSDAFSRRCGWPVLVPTVLVISVLCGFSAGSVFADPLNLDASWRYFRRGGDEVDQEALGQFYNLNFTKGLTSGMDFTGTLRYSEDFDSTREDTRLINPSARLDIRNDLFFLNINGAVFEQDPGEAPDVTTHTWNVNWLSAWKNRSQVRLNYGQSDSEDDAEPSSRDLEATFYGATVDYLWRDFSLFYDYRFDRVEDDVEATVRESDRHLGRIEFARNLGSRVTLTVSEQVSHTENRTEIGGAGGEAFVPLDPSRLFGAFSGGDDTPELGTLDPNPLLINGDFNTSAGVEIAQTLVAQNIALQTDFNPVSQIRVFLDRDVLPSTRALLNWSIYTSDDGTVWNPLNVAPIVRFEEEIDQDFVVLEIPEISERYIKVVVGTSSLAVEPLFVTEVVAGRLVMGGERTELTEFRTSFGINYQPHPHWIVGYRLGHTLRTLDPGLDFTQLNQNLSASYNPGRLLSLLLSLNESRDDFDGREDQSIRSYSAAVGSSPIPTLDLSFGYTHTDGYVSDDRERSSDTVSANVIAQLFPDLAANLLGTWTETESFSTDTDSRTYQARLEITARVSPRLTADANADHTHTDSDLGGSGTSTSTTRNRYGAGVSYRPSDLLIVQSAVARDEEEESTLFTGNVFMRWTPKIQTNGRITLDLEGDQVENYSLLFNWYISRIFSLNALANYSVADETEAWSFLNTLTANF